jgi:hypothetical protein
MLTDPAKLAFLVKKTYIQNWHKSIRNFQKKSENFKPTIFVRKVRKIIELMLWLG